MYVSCVNVLGEQSGAAGGPGDDAEYAAADHRERRGHFPHLTLVRPGRNSKVRRVECQDTDHHGRVFERGDLPDLERHLEHGGDDEADGAAVQTRQGASVRRL